MDISKLYKNKRLVRRLLYGKIFHYLLEYYITHGKWITTFNKFVEYILTKLKSSSDFYLIQISNLDSKELMEILRVYWIRYNKKPKNLIRLYNIAKKEGYIVRIEYPIIILKKDKPKHYYIDVLMYNPKKRHVIVIEIKTGTKRRKRSNIKQTINYERLIKSIPMFNSYKKVEAYIYWYRYDEFEKI